ncbi:MAG TPA: HIT family protein [Burkholderiales bacterium]|nr:HIT family protein [Burkholderiales bacterium]
MCELCERTGGDLLWQNGLCRVVLVEDEDYPGFCRVILNRHVAEMTDLDDADRIALMRVVFGVEKAVRDALFPDKINLASLGNVVPHLHWHVIPRFESDRHFPNPVWGKALRDESVPLPPGWEKALVSGLSAFLENEVGK